MIVTDSNILAYLYLPGPYTEAAVELFERDPEWTAPILWRSEFRNILVSELRAGRLRLGQAVAIQTDAEGLLQGAEYEIDSAAVLALANESGCTAYDCEFIALAQSLATKLVTMDGELLDRFPETARSLTEPPEG